MAGHGRAKSTQARVVGIITDKMQPYTFFIEPHYLKIRCRDASRLIFPILLFVYLLTLPSLLTSSIYLVILLYIHVNNIFHKACLCPNSLIGQNDGAVCKRYGLS